MSRREDHIQVPQDGAPANAREPGLTVSGDETSVEERVLSHPLFGEPTIRTIPSVEAYYACKRRMLDGICGFSLLGERGSGHRVALKVIRTYLAQEFPGLGVLSYLLPRYPPTNSRAVLADLLASAGMLATGGSRAAQFQRLMNLQQEKALVSGIPRSIVFLYGAEHVNEVVCNTLLEIRDGLLLRGIRLFTISGSRIGLFTARISMLRGLVGDDDLGAIFGSVHQLRGLEGVEDYRALFAEIDTLTVDMTSQITWTEALLPLAYHNGFRLASQAPALQTAIEDRTSSKTLPIRALISVVRQVISMAAHLDSPDFEIPPYIWKDAVGIVMGVGAIYLPSVGK
ncbi:hypothetical protein ACMAVI_001859 [Burkholderia cenocepacia]